MEVTFNNFYEFADWIHKSEKHREELEQENIDLTKEVRQLRNELKKVTAGNSDDVVIPKVKPFNTDSIPRIFKGRDSNVK